MRRSHEQNDPDRRGRPSPQQARRVDVQPARVPRPQIDRDRDRRRGDEQEHGREVRRHDRADVRRQELHQRALQLEGGRLHRVQQAGVRKKAGSCQNGIAGKVTKSAFQQYKEPKPF